MKSARFFAILALVAFPSVLTAQDSQRDLRESQMRLDSIRQERLRLQREMEQVQIRVQDASRELANIGQQRAMSAAAFQELELQVSILNDEVEETRGELEETRSELDRGNTALRQRLRWIYEQGPLHSIRVLLSAQSFGDLLNRYKYLHQFAVHDRRVIEQVADLEQQLAAQDESLEQTLDMLDDLRTEKETELAQLRRTEQQSQQRLAEYRRAQSEAAARLDEAQRDENRLSSLIEQLEAARMAEERRRAEAGTAPVAGSVSTRDLGTLDWPVNGQLIYRFGPVQKASGVTLINKGIGIAAPAGTPVRTVEAGTVSLARPFEGYGPTVMVDHGNGFYTLYMYLRTIMVEEGATLARGDVVGTVGGDQTPEGSHLYFQVRAPIEGGVPEAVDPLNWLSRRAAGG